MLQSLTIKNFGLIEQIEIDFTKNLNIFTGETGAGKSILIDALRFSLGLRVKPSVIRNPDHPCIVQSVFEVSNQLASSSVFEDFLNGECELIIQRSLNNDGKSKIKINGFVASVGQLKEIGNILIDFHGPHDHQLLLFEDQHIKILDTLVDFKDEKNKYADAYNLFIDIKSRLENLQKLGENKDQELDFLKHQLNEFKSISLNQQDYENIEQQFQKINHQQKLLESCQEILTNLSTNDVSADSLISDTYRGINQLVEIDPSCQEINNLYENTQSSLQDLIAQINDYASSLNFDSAESQEIQDAYFTYKDLLKKHGPNIEQVIKKYDELSSQFEQLTNLEYDNSKLKQNYKDALAKANTQAKQLTKLREKTAKNLIKTIENELSDLGFAHVKFDIKIIPKELDASGQDQISFYISPNAGEDLKPLADIVSSGEAARIMLALKRALMDVDPIECLIFDEIDAQIGGRLGTTIGKKLAEISKKRQVILITHLPQIASFANQHIKIYKSVIDQKTLTQITYLDQDQRIEELAQMMSGKDQTDISLSHAQDMLKTAQTV